MANDLTMVGVAQLVEPRVVIPVVVGSSPIVHPNIQYGPLAQLAEQRTLNPQVRGSIPRGPTILAIVRPVSVAELPPESHAPPRFTL